MRAVQRLQNAIGAAVKQLNESIRQALINRFDNAGNNRLVITYEPDSAGPFGALRIEYFVCETFNIEFDFSFAKPSPGFSLTIRYTNEPDVAPFDGAIFINRRLNNQETRVPAFDCSERNQCDNMDYTPLCEGPDPEPSVSIEPDSVDAFQLTGKVGNLDENEIIAWVWDLLVAQPTEPFYEGQTVRAQVENPSGPVRLTAITQIGCFGIDIENLDQ